MVMRAIDRIHTWVADLPALLADPTALRRSKSGVGNTRGKHISEAMTVPMSGQ